MNRKERAVRICNRMNEEYGTEYVCYLNHENAWQLLFATILSAQCTDARVNIVTKDLFAKYRSLEAFSQADTLGNSYHLIYSCMKEPLLSSRKA